MPLLGKHLASESRASLVLPQEGRSAQRMTDRALRQYVFATPTSKQGLARTWPSRAHDAKDVHGQPDSVRLFLFGRRCSPRAPKLGVKEVEGDRQLGGGRSIQRGRLRTYSRFGPVRGAVVLQRLRDRTGRPRGLTHRGTMTIDSESTPLLAQSRQRGIISGGRRQEFEFRSRCIWTPRAGSSMNAKPAKTARKRPRRRAAHTQPAAAR